jgi:methionyl aminopeptidase
MDKVDFDAYLKAGEIAREVKVFVRGYVRRGMRLIDIGEAVDGKILELGGDYAFPVGLGVDEVAAHFTPDRDSCEVAEGLLKIDIGVCVDGFIADTALSLDLSADGRYGGVIDFNEKILSVASARVLGCEGDLMVRDIGNVVSDFVDKSGSDGVVVRGLCGHSLDCNVIHCAPSVPNVRNENGYVFDDDAFAVEPFVSMGSGEIVEGKGGGIYVLRNSAGVRDRDARKVVEFVGKRFCGRPFCKRWVRRAIRSEELQRTKRQELRTKSVLRGSSALSRDDVGIGDVEERKLDFIFGMLTRQGVFYEYPILLERSRKPVSQVEDTFVVANGKRVCTTGDEGFWDNV